MGVPGQNAGVGTHSLLQGIFRRPRDQTQVSRVAGRFFIVGAARDAQECWSGQPIPSPGDLPDPGIEPGSPAGQAASLHLIRQGSPILTILLHLKGYLNAEF